MANHFVHMATRKERDVEVDGGLGIAAGTYRTALEAATGELDNLFEEAKRLRNRKEQIDSAITALKPLLASGADVQTASQAMPGGSYAQGMGTETIPIKEQIDAALGLVLA